jgi:hypothetical protein
MDTLRAPSVASFDVETFGRAYRGFADAYVSYAEKAPTEDAAVGAEAAAANRTIVANASTVAAQTTAFSTANIMGELQKRLLAMFQDLTLAGAARKHPGLEHKAGVPVGGTLLLAYAAKSDVEALIRQNIAGVQPAIGAARSGFAAAGIDIALDAALAELQAASKSPSNDPLDDFVVLADFCLPYACCDTDCSDVELSGRIPVDPFGKVKEPGSMAQPPILPGDPAIDAGRLRGDVTGGGGIVVRPGGGTVVTDTRTPARPSDPTPSPPVSPPVTPRGGTVVDRPVDPGRVDVTRPVADRRAGVVQGTVVVKNERGNLVQVDGAVVVAVSGETGETFRIDTERGRFRAELPVGEYKIRGTATGHRGSSQLLVLEPGDSVTLQLEVTPTG